MPDLTDAKHQLAEALTEAGALPQWEDITADGAPHCNLMRIRIPGGWLYGINRCPQVFVPASADIDAVDDTSLRNARLTAEAERDAARAHLHRLEEENGRLRGQLAMATAAEARRCHRINRLEEESLRIDGELRREQSGREAAEARCAELRADISLVRQQASDHEKTADEYRRWRDEALKMVEELQRKDAELRRQAEDWQTECLNARQDRDTARAAIQGYIDERDAARAAADEWAAIARDVAGKAPKPASDPCPLRAPANVGPSSFVMRGCALEEGHEGPCKPL